MPGKPSGERVKDSASFAKARNKAAEYANDPAKLNSLVEEAAKKAESKKGPLAEVWEFLMACVRMLKGKLGRPSPRTPNWDDWAWARAGTPSASAPSRTIRTRFMASPVARAPGR